MNLLTKSRRLVITKFLANHQYTEAETASKRYIDLYPNDGFGWKTIGAVYFFLNRYQEAQESLIKAITIDNSDPESTSILGNLLREQGKIRAALDCYERSLKIDSDHLPALNGKGLCLMLLGHTEQAISFLRKH